MKLRRSLTHVGGTATTSGDRDVAAKLAEALDVAPAPEPDRSGTDDIDRTHVHGFHTYPARMHPTTAGRLVRALSREGSTVLDPFCGSGTILVEAMIAGRRAVGTDLNPIAAKLARLKTTPLDKAAREMLIAVARQIAEEADARRIRRAGATRRYPPEDVQLFDPHVLLELDSIRAGIMGLARAEDAGPGKRGPKAPPEDAASAAAIAPIHDALALVLSSLLVKLSRRASDTSQGASARRIAAGYPARLFVRKTGELARRFEELEKLLPPGSAPARVALDDALRLRTVGAATVDAVVTSPPYVATYDYLAQHALRLRWLDLDAKPFSAGEMGSRRRYQPLDARAARETWVRELGGALRAMARVCRKGARVGLVLADSGIGDQALRADEILAVASEHAGLVRIAAASQIRPHFHGPTAAAFDRVPRSEHAIALEKR